MINDRLNGEPDGGENNDTPFLLQATFILASMII
jgi:hypothetical protein